MSVRKFKAAALVCLLLAIAAVAAALLASQRRVAIQGPSAIAPLPDGTVWLAVEDALWRFDAEGRRMAVVPASAHGMPRAIGALAPHPDGRLVAWARGDAALHFLDPATGAPRGRIVPQWPADLRQHGDRAIHYAFHPDGRVAIATGGGHAVAVFGADGRFLGRTAPGTYEFTNGLWWHGDRLWTTDTNRFALVELDGATLREQSRTVLQGPLARCRFLGLAAPREGGAAPGRGLTLIRFANGMLEGEPVEVEAGGVQRMYRDAFGLQPRDAKWHRGELLLVDGASYAVRRYSADRALLGEFGDAASRDSMARSLRERQALGLRYHGGLAAAVVLFLAGLALAWRASALEKGARLRGMDVDLSQLGTPLLDARARLRLVWPLFWPMALSAAVLLAFRASVHAPFWSGLLPPRAFAFAAAAFALLIGAAAAALLWRKLRNGGQDAGMDALLNQPAVLALARRDAFWTLREPGELPRETLMLGAGRGGRHWLVLTNRRLLVFVSNLADARLVRECARRDVVRAAVVTGKDLRPGQRISGALLGGCWLRLDFRDGERLEGMTMTRLTAERFARLLGAAAPAFGDDAAVRMAPARTPAASRLAPGRVPDESRAAWQTLASLLVPGLGQWMQRRAGTALLMFLLWAGVVIVAALPVAWTLWAPRAAVSAQVALGALAVYAAVCLAAGVDAWRMRDRTA